MYLENYEDSLVVFLLICDIVMVLFLVKSFIEFRKANKEFEAMMREKRATNNQFKKK